MNIRYHLAIGIGLDLMCDTKGLMTAYSVLPDFPLIYNEVKLWRTKRKFVASEVDQTVVDFYMITHSLWFCSFALFVSPSGFVAYLLHIIFDWFTHTGRFAGKPFFPFNNYTIKFGREILK